MLDADACIELDPATAPVSQLPVRASTVELTNDNDASEGSEVIVTMCRESNEASAAAGGRGGGVAVECGGMEQRRQWRT